MMRTAMPVGRLDKLKHPEKLINILLMLHKRNQNIHIYYLGDGEQKLLISSMIEKNAIKRYVH